MLIFGRLFRGALLNQVGAEGNAAAGSAGGNSAAGGEGAAQGGSAAGAAAGANGAAAGQAGNGQAAKTFTQEEVNRIAAQAREDGRKSATNKAAGEQEQKKDDKAAAGGQQAPDVAALAQQAVTAALQAAGLDPFSVAARQAGYNDAQVSLARAAHDAAKPPDLGKWLTEWPTQVGITIKQGGGLVGPTATASHGAAPRKVEDMRDDAGLVDVFSLTPEQVLAMGPTKVREEFEKTLAVSRERSGAPPLPAALRKQK